jgi:hypothetical protein
VRYRSDAPWLSRSATCPFAARRDQAERLLEAPPNTLMGVRDRAILGLLGWLRAAP